MLVGKGVTFDSGGVSIKPSQGMDEMRGDMGGAATMVAAILAAARLNTQGKVIGKFIAVIHCIIALHKCIRV